MKGQSATGRGVGIESGIDHVMGGESSSRRADRIIAALAAKQHGVAARWQLLQAGVTARRIELRLQSGRLHEIHRGVYLVGHDVPPPLAIEQAALLACGKAAVLSHRTAANLWDILPYPASAPVWTTVPPGRTVERPRITVRRSPLTARETRNCRGLRLTSPPRTILDLSSVIDLEELESVVAEASYRRLASETELTHQVACNEGKRGLANLRHVMGLEGGPQRTRSNGERAMLRLVRRAGMTGYKANVRIHGWEVDLLWRDSGVAVEIDGWDGHSSRVAFERDRLKAATLTSHGLIVIPITGRQLRDDPDGVIDRLRRAIARRELRLIE
jgi:very-short-patch-repair endonuclease